MNVIWTLVQLVCLFVTGLATVVMVVSLRKERRVGMLATIFSTFIAAVSLPAYLLLTGARLNWWIGVLLFGAGMLAGFLRGSGTRLVRRDKQVWMRHSLLFVAGWLGTWIVLQLLGLVNSVVLTTVGLLPVYFSTGTQVGMNENFVIRLLTLEPAAPVAPPFLPEARRSVLPPLPESVSAKTSLLPPSPPDASRSER